MRVAILGTGGIGLGSAALLAERGHRAILWSPSGRGITPFANGAPLRFAGALSGACPVETAADCGAAIAGADVVLIAVPGNGHRRVIDAAAPHLTARQWVVISSLSSFSSLYLSRRLAARRLSVPIVAWGTTALTARRAGPGEVSILTVRSSLDAATMPAGRATDGRALCATLFGDRFAIAADHLAIGLGNINPLAHGALAIGNLTRIERGETWPQYHYMTGTVSRLIESLDDERRAVAGAFGLAVPTIRDHFHRSFGIAPGPLARMAADLHAKRNGPPGPTTIKTRFVTEDAPFGLVPFAAVARAVGVPAPLHAALVALLGGFYGRDFAAENDLMPDLDLDRADAATLHRRLRDGWTTA